MLALRLQACRMGDIKSKHGNSDMKQKAWDVYRKCGVVSVWCDRVYFQPQMEASEVHAAIEDDYDYSVIVKADDIDEVE